MNRLYGLLIIVCLWGFAASPLSAQSTEPIKPDAKLLKQLIYHATDATNDNWLEDHWEHTSKRKASKDGAMSYVSAMYWNFLAAQMLNDKPAAQRSLKHYQYMVKNWWNPDKKRFNTGYDFLFNTHIVISFALSLRDAPDVIPAEIQDDMREKICGMCAYLPTYTTALKNTNDDLRANNQDAFAAYALILAGKLLDDQKIADDAMVKFQSVLDCVDGPFWREGGVDVGYQLVGEPGMMGAADLLWDQLDYTQKKQISDLSLLGRMVNGFTFENCRSPSRYFPDSRTVSVGLLNHLSNPLLAYDAYARVSELVSKPFSNWELYDLSPLCYHGALVNNYQSLLKTTMEPGKISWGGIGTQMMKIDESKKPNTGMTRAMFSDPTGMVLIAGDHSMQNPRQAFKKQGATEPFDEFDPGGMRYLGLKEHMYVWVDAHDGLPAITNGQSKLKRKLVESKAYVGFAASQYQVKQELTDQDGRSQSVTQLFVPVQGMLLIITQAQPGQTLKGLRYSIPVPAVSSEASGSSLHIKQNRLNNKQQVSLSINSLVGGMPVIRDEKVEPYHRATVQIGSPRFDTPKALTVVDIPLGDQAVSVIALVPDANAKAWQSRQVKTQYVGNRLHITCMTPENQQVDLHMAFEPIAELAGVENPLPGLAQIFIQDQNQLTGFTVHGKAMKLEGQTWFKAASPISISGLQMSQGSILQVTGKATLYPFWSTSARSLIDNQQVIFPHEQTHRAGRWWLKSAD